jgi:hypothetical protein
MVLARRLLPVAASLVLLGASACGSGRESVTVDPGRPVLVEGVDMDGGSDVLIAGVVTVVNGCLGLRDGDQAFAVVWPKGSEYEADEGTTFRLPSGHVLDVGDEFSGGGGWEHQDSSLVPSGLPGGCFSDRVAVLNEDQAL